MNFSLIESFLIILFIALIVTVVCRRLKLPIILGYVLVGALVSPHALGWLPDTQAIKALAEFGVVLLMFTVGLEFSLPKLYALRYAVFVLGGLQVLISMLITVMIGMAFGMLPVTSVVMGGVVAMSSTAVVMKQLSDQLEAHTKHGLNAVGILLFQDLAVIPILVFVASVSGASAQSFWEIIVWSLVKGTLAFIVILVLGQRLLRPLFRLIAATRAIELFTLSVLLVSVGAAWLTHLLGLSYALGAFLAGIMLAECEYKSQIKTEIRPFRDILLGLFFISVGMLVNINLWSQTWLWTVLLVAGLMLGKPLLIIVLNFISKQDIVTAVRTGLVLGQGGEFGFAILTLALANQLMPVDWGQSVLAALLIAFIFSPIIIRYNENITAFLLPKPSKRALARTRLAMTDVAKGLHDHIIVCGYGRVGEMVAQCLRRASLSYIGIDLDPDRVRVVKQAGDTVAYGDATHHEILELANVSKAKAVLISFSDSLAATSILNQLRTGYPDLPVLVRCHDEAEAEILRGYGATYAVVETFEESLTLAHHLLKCLQMPHAQIASLLQSVRDKHH